MRYAFTVAGQTHHVVLEEHADGPRFIVEGTALEPKVTAKGDGHYHVTIGDRSFAFHLRNGRVEMDGAALEVQIRRARPQLIRAGGKGRKANGQVKPPMPGKVVEIHVAEGAEVTEGQSLLVLEAMKMQNDIKSPVAGTVTKVHVGAGQNVEATTVMVVVEPKVE